MAVISTSMLNLHNSCPFSMSNYRCLAKKATPTGCITIKSRCSSSLKTISNYKISKANNNFSTCSSPWLMLPSKEAQSHNTSQPHTLYDRCFYDIVNKTFVARNPKNTSNLDPNHQEYLSDDMKCIGASHGWLAFIDPSDCSLYLINPLTTQTIQLPPIETLAAFNGACYRKLDDRRFKITGFIYRGFDEDELLLPCKHVVDHIVDKIILTSSPLKKDCMVVLSAHSRLTSLAFCKIGDKKWTNLDEAEGCFSDVVYRKKDNKLYACQNSEDNDIEIWDLSDASSPRKTMLEYKMSYDPKVKKKFDLLKKKKPCMAREYLVEASSSGRLLMVVRSFSWHVSENDKLLSSKDDTSRRYPYKTLRFDVFEFDQGKKEFVDVMDLGDMALFVGINHSVAASASEMPGVEPNAIYFGDHYLMERFDHMNPHGDRVPLIMFGGHDFGVYNVGDDYMISPCYPSLSKQFLPPPVWIVP